MHYHLIGICGTAMAAPAGMLQARGHRVSGSDENVYLPMSTMLASLGIVFGRPINWTALGISALITVLLLIYASYSFRRMEKTFADIV